MCWRTADGMRDITDAMSPERQERDGSESQDESVIHIIGINASLFEVF
jgi:hypothetical protein